MPRHTQVAVRFDHIQCQRLYYGRFWARGSGEHWLNIRPIIAISGFFCFAWTTNSLVDVVAAHGRLLEQLENERERQRGIRMTARKAEWEVLTKEREAARAAGEQARNQAAGVGFLERRKIRRQEKRKEAELRAAVKEEIKDIRRKERSDEEKLGPGDPGDQSR